MAGAFLFTAVIVPDETKYRFCRLNYNPLGYQVPAVSGPTPHKLFGSVTNAA